MSGKTLSLIRSVLNDRRKVLIFTAPTLVETLATEIQSSGFPALSVRWTGDQTDKAALDRFATFDRGALVTSTARSTGWRCDAHAIIFAETQVCPERNEYRQLISRIGESRTPLFINCEFPNLRPFGDSAPGPILSSSQLSEELYAPVTPHIYTDLAGNGYCSECGMAEDHDEALHIKPMTVAQLPSHLAFVSDSSEVQGVREALNLSPDEDFDSFFVATRDGEYTEVWGMPGIVPENHRSVFPISLARR